MDGGPGRGQAGGRGTPAASGDERKILIFAGPNGAGKTTFATEWLPNEARCPFFINADAIAAGLNPFDPTSVAYPAARLMMAVIKEYTSRGESFAFETTLSGRGHARSIRRWRALGYRVKLFFLRLPSEEMAVERVRQRVIEGGHDVEEKVIRRRFRGGLRNFAELYRDIVDEWAMYDNSGTVPVLLDEGGRGDGRAGSVEDSADGAEDRSNRGEDYASPAEGGGR